MTNESLQSGPRHGSNRQKIVSDFMLAEFNALQERARYVAQGNAVRINVFVLIVAVVMASLGLAASLQTPPAAILKCVALALATLFVLGLVILHIGVNSHLAIVELYRDAGRLRCWFADLAPDAAPHFALVPAADQQHYAALFSPLRGAELLVVVVNAMLACGLLAVLLNLVFGQVLVAVLVGLVIFAATWILQEYYVEERMESAQGAEPTGQESRFPHWTHEERFAAAADD